MFYLDTKIEHLWIKGFSTVTSHDFLLVSLVVAAVVFLKTCLSAVLSILYESDVVKLRKKKSTYCRRIVFHTIGAILTVIDCILGYLLMVAVMLGNVWLILVIILASTISYFFTFWSRIYLPKYKKHARNWAMPHENTAETNVFLQANGEGDQTPKEEVPIELQELDKRPQVTDEDKFLPFKSFGYAADGDKTETTVELSAPPDILPNQSSSFGDKGSAITIHSKTRPEAIPLLEKYPVLRFHNIDVKDTSPGLDPEAMQFEELDKLVKELQS